MLYLGLGKHKTGRKFEKRSILPISGQLAMASFIIRLGEFSSQTKKFIITRHCE
jgi:hypothetical protein